MRKIFKKIIVFILSIEAKIVLRKYKPKIVAITGSVGKTSAKETIFAALDTSFYVRKSRKSYNSEIGIPLAVLGVETGWGSPWKWFKNIIEGALLIILPNIYPKWLVLEAGVDHPKDMDFIAGLIKTDLVVFSRFPDVPVHAEFFNSPEEIFREKIKLLKTLKNSGALILNYDDKKIRSIKDGSGKHALTYGFDEGANIRASNLEVSYKESKPAGINFKVNIGGGSFPVFLEGVLGEQFAYSILSAVAVSHALNLNIIKVIEAFQNFKSPAGRMRILDAIFDSTVIDDSYNSSPVALEKALEAFRSIEIKKTEEGGGRKIAVLGDMMELGRFEKNEHRVSGEIVGEFTDFLLTVGRRAKFIAEGARNSGFPKEKIYEFEDSDSAGEFLKNFIRKGDLILIKGSQSLRLEKVTKTILARPEEAKLLLVRQEKEWQNR